jgi:hypothetical protein
VSLFADHGVGFPIPNAVAQVNDCKAFLNGYSILDLAAPLDTAIALGPLLLTLQAGVKDATVTLICIDMPRLGDKIACQAVGESTPG